MKPRGILIHVPSADQKMNTVTAQSLFNAASYLASVGIPTGLESSSASDIEDMRNLAVTCWYDQYPEFSHLLFVDSDMGFPCDTAYGKPNLIRDMIKFDKPLVGCFYAKRKADPEIVGSADPHTIADVQHGFIKVTGMGCGVMLIHRDVITTMLEKLPHISDRVTSLLARARPDAKLNRIIGAFAKLHTDERMLNEARINSELLQALGRSEDLEQSVGTWLEGIKNNRLHDGRRLRMSEDMSFCYRWIEQCGGEVWANVRHHISHIGPFDYHLRYESILEAKAKAEAEVKAEAA
jgi:hypothetical protein